MRFTAVCWHWTYLHSWMLYTALHITARTRFYAPQHCTATSLPLHFISPCASLDPALYCTLHFTASCTSLHPALHCSLHFTAPCISLHHALHSTLHLTAVCISQYPSNYYTSPLSTALKFNPLHCTAIISVSTEIHCNYTAIHGSTFLFTAL